MILLQNQLLIRRPGKLFWHHLFFHRRPVEAAKILVFHHFLRICVRTKSRALAGICPIHEIDAVLFSRIPRPERVRQNEACPMKLTYIAFQNATPGAKPYKLSDGENL
jgi:hypothetical protein